VPVELARAATDDAAMPAASHIHIELARGGTQLCVRWPAAQADSCAVWRREHAAAALKN
jgi:transposase